MLQKTKSPLGTSLRRTRRPKKKDLARYVAVRYRGVSIDELAVQENVEKEAIQKSIEQAENYKFFNSEEFLQARYFEMGIELLPRISRVLSDAMEAVHVLEGGGEQIDYKTRMEATEKVKDFLGIFRQRGASFNTNVNVGIQNNPATFNGRSLEGIVRSEQQKVKLKGLPAPVEEDIIDAEEDDPVPVNEDVPIRFDDEDEDEDEDGFAEDD